LNPLHGKKSNYRTQSAGKSQRQNSTFLLLHDLSRNAMGWLCGLEMLPGKFVSIRNCPTCPPRNMHLFNWLEERHMRFNWPWHRIAIERTWVFLLIVGVIKTTHPLM
jgi:hypothetical protein